MAENLSKKQDDDPDKPAEDVKPAAVTTITPKDDPLKPEAKKMPPAERIAALEAETTELKRRIDQTHGVYSTSEELSKANSKLTKTIHAMNGANIPGAKRFIITRPVQRKKVVNGKSESVTDSSVHIERYFVGTATELLDKLEREVRWKGDGKFPYAVAEA